jgi:hypothetical protein
MTRRFNKPGLSLVHPVLTVYRARTVAGANQPAWRTRSGRQGGGHVLVSVHRHGCGEQNRRRRAPRAVHVEIQTPIEWWEERVALLDADRQHQIRGRAIWREQDDWLQSMPGIGPVVSRTLWAEWPAWGPLDRRAMAAVVGGLR